MTLGAEGISREELNSLQMRLLEVEDELRKYMKEREGTALNMDLMRMVNNDKKNKTIVTDRKMKNNKCYFSFCPLCGHEGIKQNSESPIYGLFRCRLCNGEFLLDLRYFEPTNTNYFQGKVDK